jgi:hypothetical protein
MSRSKFARKRVNNVKSTILRKKILMTFLVDDFAFYDKISKNILIAAAALPVLLGVISSVLQKLAALENRANTDGVIIDIVIIILNAVVIGLIKLKESFKYDKYKEAAKEQSIRYSQLYDKIENDFHNEEQTEDNFLYWMSREYGMVEMNDPEVSVTQRRKFEAECARRNIPYEDDVTALQNLTIDGSADDSVANSTTTLETAANDNESNRTNYVAARKTYDNNASLTWVMNRLNQSK